MNNTQYREEKKIIDTDDSDRTESLNKITHSGNSIISINSKLQNKMANNENFHETLLAIQNQLTRLQLEVETIRNNNIQHNDNDDNRENENSDGNSSEQSEAVCNPIVTSVSSLKAYLEMITEFDGNNIFVETFIFEINSILNDIQANQKTTFLRLIISKKISSDKCNKKKMYCWTTNQNCKR